MHLLPHQYDDNVKDMDTTAVAKDDSRFRRFSFGITTKVVALSGLAFLTLVSLYNTVQVQYNVPRYLNNAYTYATDNVDLSHLPPLSTSNNSLSNREEDKQASSTVAAEGSKISSVRSIFTEPMNFKEFEMNKQRRKYNPDVCQLFDFAVTGFAKCGTTSTHAWIDAHNDTRVAKGEQWNFFRNPMVAAANIQKKTIKNGPGEKRGYVNPHDIQWPTALDFYTQTCPNTKLVVLIRHPVLWFESFYNYRKLYGDEWAIKGEPNELIKRVQPTKGNYVNSASGAFHKWLAVLGKTELNEDEMDLLNGWYNSTDEFRDKTIDANDDELQWMTKVKNPVFVMDILQLGDKNTTHMQQLSNDLSGFLGLSGPLASEIPHSNSASAGVKRNKKRTNLMIDICDEELKPIHDEMMLVARNASLWINKYFLESSEVSYSGNLKEIVEGWQVDPCIQRSSQ